MNNYCANLKFNFKPFKNNFDISQLKNAVHSGISLNDIDDEFIKLLDQLGLQIRMAECFYRKAHEVSGIHRDVKGSDSATKINWVYGGNGSTMNWYRRLTDTERYGVSVIGFGYMFYEKEDVELVHSQTIGFPSLLEVALPHSITMGNEERLCISILLQYKDSTKSPTFLESLEIFKDYIVE